MSPFPYLILSDLHFHAWTAFAETTPTGVNTRLQLLLDAVRYAAAELKAKGGNKIFLAGDVFHKRGEVAPSVLNPVMDLFKELTVQGFEVYAIPGNHDLEKNDSERLANSITALESVGVKVAHEPTVIELTPGHKVVLFPWFSSVKDLIAEMTIKREDLVEDTIQDDAEPRLDAIIHAPIDGVLPHLPAHGLDANALFGTGFDRVFSGHYHNHKDMGDGVYSIGAMTHQCWGDIGSQAGFMLVYEEEVEQFPTKHPLFVELTGDETDEEAAEKAKGNYVRVRAQIEKDSELKEIREGVLALGALGVTLIPVRKTTVTRTGTPTNGKTASIEDSIKSFLDKKGARPSVHAMALDVLSEARAA